MLVVCFTATIHTPTHQMQAIGQVHIRYHLPLRRQNTTSFEECMRPPLTLLNLKNKGSQIASDLLNLALISTNQQSNSSLMLIQGRGQRNTNLLKSRRLQLTNTQASPWQRCLRSTTNLGPGVTTLRPSSNCHQYCFIADSVRRSERLRFIAIHSAANSATWRKLWHVWQLSLYLLVCYCRV